MKIIFITGKGGVGKSAVAAAVALRQSQKGVKTLLVELGDQSFYKDYFNLPVVEYKPTKLRENLDVSIWSGQECLREYALHLLKVQSLYKLFFENPISKALVSVAPALPELSILGKITSGPPRNVGPKMPYDCIVVDAYSSGHFIALLQAPNGMAKAVGIGPMAEQSRSMTAVLQDPKLCEYFVVCLPEELPVVEGLELAEKIQVQSGQKAQIILNRYLEVPAEESAGGEENKSSGAFKSHLHQIDLRQQEMKKKLNESTYGPVKRLPFVLEADPWKVVESLAKELS